MREPLETVQYSMDISDEIPYPQLDLGVDAEKDHMDKMGPNGSDNQRFDYYGDSVHHGGASSMRENGLHKGGNAVGNGIEGLRGAGDGGVDEHDNSNGNEEGDDEVAQGGGDDDADEEQEDEGDEEEEEEEEEEYDERVYELDDDINEPSGAFANVGQGLTGKYKNYMMQYWQNTIDSIERDDHDFKNHQLPLARIKKVMKTDEDVKMISAEAPILFAKGCDIFITELTMRAWIHAEENKRRTLQKSDIAAALQKSDMFDFLIDIVPREEEKKKKSDSHRHQHPDHVQEQQFYDNNQYYNS